MNENNYDPDIDFYYPAKRRKRLAGAKVGRLLATLASRLRLPQHGSNPAPRHRRDAGQ